MINLLNKYINNKGISSGELLFIIALATPLVPMAIAGQWWLFSLFFIFYIIFGVIELIAVKKTKKTVSKHFWDWSKDHKVMAWVILGSMILMWVALIWHLAIKII